MEDYTSNSNKSKEKKEAPAKKIEKVVVGDVVVQKKSIGRKFKDIFIEADLRTVTRYVTSEVLLPAFRNMIVDGASKGVERMMYGETARPRRPYGSGLLVRQAQGRVAVRHVDPQRHVGDRRAQMGRERVGVDVHRAGGNGLGRCLHDRPRRTGRRRPCRRGGSRVGEPGGV